MMALGLSVHSYAPKYHSRPASTTTRRPDLALAAHSPSWTQATEPHHTPIHYAAPRLTSQPLLAPSPPPLHQTTRPDTEKPRRVQTKRSRLATHAPPHAGRARLGRGRARARRRLPSPPPPRAPPGRDLFPGPPEPQARAWPRGEGARARLGAVRPGGHPAAAGGVDDGAGGGGYGERRGVLV
jgi:hypothetical protein